MNSRFFGLVTLAVTASFSFADVLNLDLGISDMPSVDQYGSANNFVFALDLGQIYAGAFQDYRLTALGWSVRLKSFNPSVLSDITCGLENSDVTDGVYLRPAVSDNFSGGPNQYSSGGLIDLVGPGFDVALNSDNVLVVDFFEQRDDFPGGIDAVWMNGSQLNLQFTATPVPEPVSMTVLALGIGAITTRRLARLARDVST